MARLLPSQIATAMMWTTSMSLYRVPSMPRHYAGRREDERMSGTTLQHHDTDLEIHEVVVGPVDNNVYVLRCRHTGDAVLIDAANEHEQLLELCRELKVGRVLETHGHWDHIQAVPQLRDAGYSVGVSAADAGMLDSYDEIIEHDSVIEVGDLRLRTILTPGHTPGSMCFRVEGKPLLFSGDTLFPAGRATPRFPAATSRPSSLRSRTCSSRRCRRTRSSCRAMASTPPSAPNAHISTTGSPGAGEWLVSGWRVLADGRLSSSAGAPSPPSDARVQPPPPTRARSLRRRPSRTP